MAGNAYAAFLPAHYDALAWGLLGTAVLMVLVQISLVPVFRRAPFGPGSWAFSFSYAANATLAVHWLAHDRPDGWRIWAWLAIALITAFIGLLLALSVRAIVRGRFFVRFGAGRP